MLPRRTLAAAACALLGAIACRRHAATEAPDAGPPPVVDAGTAPAPADAGGPTAAELSHPLAVLSGCAQCPESGGSQDCELCRKGWRCVRSLMNPSWAAMEEKRGYSLYRRIGSDGGSEVWRKVAQVEPVEESPEGPARLANLPEATPPDLERHMTPFDGQCPPVEKTPERAIASYFSEESGRGAPQVVSMRRQEHYARAEVDASGERGFAILSEETEGCPGWHVEAFGFEGCPVGHPEFFPPELRHAP